MEAESSQTLWPPLREATLAGVAFALLLALFFAPAALGGRVIYAGDFSGSDLLDLNVPRRYLAAADLGRGRLPHWTPLLGNGFPLLAEGQAGVFYPLGAPLFLLADLPTATNLAVLSAFWVALLGSYLLARAWGAHPLAAALGACAFGLGGVFVARLKHLNLIHVLSWLPWACLGLEGLLRRPGLPWMLATAAVLALQILAGHPHAAALALLGAAGYLLASGLAGRRPLARPAALAAAALGLALLLSAAQLLPTWELVGLASRGRGMSWQAATEFPFRPADLAYFVRPYYRGNPADASYPLLTVQTAGVFWENCAYLGLAPLVLALAAPLALPGRRAWALAAAALLALWAALGRYGGLYWILWAFVPGFSLFRFPSRFLALAALALALLAALAADRVARRSPLAAGALLALTVADLFAFQRAYVGYVPARWFEPPPTVGLVGTGRIATPLADETWQTLYRTRGGWKEGLEVLEAHRETLYPDLSALFGVPASADKAVREGVLGLERYMLLQGELRRQMSLVGEDLVVSPAALQLWRRQAVEHVVTFARLEGPGLELFYQRRPHPAIPWPLRIYRVTSPAPRVRVTGRWRAVSGPEEALAALVQPGAETVIEGAPETPPGWTGGGARLVADEGSRLRLEVEMPADGYLVVADTWHPAWKATVDGQPAPVRPADLAFRAVPVPAGSHRVDMVYASPAFRLGAALSLAALAAWLGGWVWAARRPQPA